MGSPDGSIVPLCETKGWQASLCPLFSPRPIVWPSASSWKCCSETFQLKASQAESGAEPRVGQAQKEEYPLIHPVTHSCNQHTQTGWALRSRRCFPVQTEQRHTRPRPPRTPWTELGLAMYSQKLLFSLRCPLELFGLYRSLVCRIYLGTCP